MKWCNFDVEVFMAEHKFSVFWKSNFNFKQITFQNSENSFSSLDTLSDNSKCFFNFLHRKTSPSLSRLVEGTWTSWRFTLSEFIMCVMMKDRKEMWCYHHYYLFLLWEVFISHLFSCIPEILRIFYFIFCNVYTNEAICNVSAVLNGFFVYIFLFFCGSS